MKTASTDKGTTTQRPIRTIKVAFETVHASKYIDLMHLRLQMKSFIPVHPNARIFGKCLTIAVLIQF